MNLPQIPPSPSHLSACQRSVRRRASRLPFKGAVWLAADVFFGFTHRANQGKALWSDTERVWLGNTTFLYWAMGDADIDIPRMVAKTAGAPETTNALHQAVHAELIAYWANHLVSLPCKSTPGWLPLP